MKNLRYNEIFNNFKVLAFYMEQLRWIKRLFNLKFKRIGHYNLERRRAKRIFDSKLKLIQPKLTDCIYEIVRFNNDFYINFTNLIPSYKFNHFVSIYKHKIKKCYIFKEQNNGMTGCVVIKYSINYSNSIIIGDFNLDKMYYNCILDGSRPSFNRKKTEARVKKVVRVIIKSA